MLRVIWQRKDVSGELNVVGQSVTLCDEAGKRTRPGEGGGAWLGLRRRIGPANQRAANAGLPRHPAGAPPEPNQSQCLEAHHSMHVVVSRSRLRSFGRPFLFALLSQRFAFTSVMAAMGNSESGAVISNFAPSLDVAQGEVLYFKVLVGMHSRCANLRVCPLNRECHCARFLTSKSCTDRYIGRWLLLGHRKVFSKGLSKAET